MKVWEKELPELPFSLYDFKTEFVNSKEKTQVLDDLWNNKCNPEQISVCHLHYDKYEGEGEKLVPTNNLLGGFMQRIPEILRKHALGVIGVYGEEPALEIMGVMIWRGAEVPYPLEKEHP